MKKLRWCSILFKNSHIKAIERTQATQTICDTAECKKPVGGFRFPNT